LRTGLLIVLVLFPLGLAAWIGLRGARGGDETGAAQLMGEAALPVVDGGAGVGVVAPPAVDPAEARLRALFSLPLAGLAIDGEVGLYDKDGLFDYINGAAPIFIERGYRQLAAADLTTPDGGELTCDIYDMGSITNAAKIYAKEKPAGAAWSTVGEESYRGSMAMVFRRDRYYVKLTAFDKQAEAQLPALAELIARRAGGAQPATAPLVDAPAVDPSAAAADAPPETPAAETPAAETPAAALPADPDAILRGLLRAPLAGAAVDGEVGLYDKDGLFDYINGAAPIFIERGYRKLVAADLKTESGGELTCDVFDMQSADNATAICQKERPASATAAQVGDEGHSGSMALAFRSGRYYVKLTAFDKQAEAFLPELAALLIERMP